VNVVRHVSEKDGGLVSPGSGAGLSLWLRRWLPALIVCAGMLPSAWLLLKFRDTPQLGFLEDDVMYIGAAQSLLETGTYREAALPGNFWQTKYPPGYPLLLAAILKLRLPAGDFAIIAFSWLWLFAACIALAWAMTESGLSRIQSAAVAGIWAANPAASLVATSALSEAPFCAVMFLAIGLAQRAYHTRRASIAAVCGVLLGIAGVIRTAGIIAAGAIFIWLLWRRRWKAASCLAGAAAVLPALWMGWSHAHLPSGQDYVTRFYFDYGGAWLHTIRAAGWRAMVPRNLVFGVMAIGGWLIASYSRLFLAVFRDVLLTVIAVLAMNGWDGAAFSAVAMATMAVLSVYFFPSDGRFFLLAAPAFLAAVIVNLSSRPFLARAAVLAAVIVADIFGTGALATDYSAKRERRDAFAPAYGFIRSELPADAVILTGDAHIWLRTGRRIVGMPLPMEYFYLDRENAAVDEMFLHYKETARNFGATYILLSPWGMGSEIPGPEARERFFQSVRSDPDLDRVFSSNQVELFKINQTSADSLQSTLRRADIYPGDLSGHIYNKEYSRTHSLSCGTVGDPRRVANPVRAPAACGPNGWNPAPTSSAGWDKRLAEDRVN
jgi:hypothetical protein